MVFVNAQNNPMLNSNRSLIQNLKQKIWANLKIRTDFLNAGLPSQRILICLKAETADMVWGKLNGHRLEDGGFVVG